jgi:hypothetical protein
LDTSLKSNNTENKLQTFSKKEKLEYLAAHYDPFSLSDPCALPTDILMLLMEFDLDPKNYDPYFITGQVLVMLDELDER